MGPAAILFDKDGTLVDFDRTFGPAGYAVLCTLSGGNPAVFSRLAACLHYDVAKRRFLETSPFIAGTTLTYGPIVAEALGRNDRAVLYGEMDALLRIEALKSIAPIGDPQAVLAALAGRGLRLGIATNDTEQAARTQAEALGMTPHLDFVAGYDSGYGVKPGPGMVLAFAERFALHPSCVALVGDSVHDMQAARTAGSLAIAVLSGPASRAELAPQADHVLDQIADLPAFLDALRSRDDSGG